MTTTLSSTATPGRNRYVVGVVTPKHRAGMLIIKWLLAILAPTIGASDARAQVLYSWGNPSGGNYGSAVNWFPGAGAPPGPNDGAEFGLAATYTVSFFSDYTVSDAYVSAGNVTWDLGFGTEYLYTVNAIEVTGSGSQLRILDGNVTANSLLISNDGDVAVFGANRNDAANITVTGVGSSLTHNNFLEVADHRSETMTIQNGGTVVSGTGSIGADLIDGSPGIVTVTGTVPAGDFVQRSSWMITSSHLDVGDLSPGTLNILDGAAVVDSSGFIGADAPGTVNVDGIGSTWTNTFALRIGVEDSGTLNITAGGKVSNTDGIAGANSGSGNITVSGTGSMWTNSGNLTMGFNSDTTGTLIIEAGGAVSSANSVIGNAGGSVDFDTAVGTVTVTGGGSTWTNSADLTVAFEGIGTVNVQNGGAVSSALGKIGYAPNSEGNVNVSGSGSTWTNSGTLEVGRQGKGALSITSGGDVTSGIGQVGGSNAAEPDTGNGTVFISGSGSSWTASGNIHLGYQNTGTMIIASGGSVSNDNGFIGTFAGASGAVDVAGAGSTWTNSDSLNIGSAGDGVLIVETGGVVTNTDGHVGPSPGSVGTVYVKGVGSGWNMTGDLFLGAQGTGTLTIENGGHVSSNSGNLARAGGTPFGSGTATVTGAGSTWTNNGELRVGNNGIGTLNIQNGGSVANTAAFIATTGGSTGTVNVNGAGAQWSVAGRLSVAGDTDTMTTGGTGTLDINPGGTVGIAQDTVIFSNGLVRLQGGTLSTSAISFQGGGQFQWTSGTLHVGAYNGNLTNQGGKLAPGNSAGSTTITGNYTQQAGGILQIEIGGTSAGTSYDVVNVAGIAGISGQLQLALLGNFLPSASNAFIVLNAAGSVFGAFSNVANGQRLTTPDGGGSFLVNYGAGSPFNPNQLVLSAFQAVPLPGDYNANGGVDASDYIVWRKTLTQTGSGLAADGNGNGQIDPGDYYIWRAHFGQTAGSGSVAIENAAVPEPATLVLLIIAITSVRLMCRSRT